MAKKEYILIDSNLIINFFRGNLLVKDIISQFENGQLCISEITVMELLIGCNTIKK